MNDVYVFTEEQINAALERVRQKLTDSLNAPNGTLEQRATHLLTGSKIAIRSTMAVTFFDAVEELCRTEKLALQTQQKPVPVRFGVVVHDWDTAFQLAQFVKRASFNTCLRLTDAGDSNDQAYKMIEGIACVKRGLDSAGISPR